MQERGGNVFPKKNITRSSLETSKENLDEPCARKGGDVFLETPLAHPTSKHLEGCTQQGTSKDAHNKAPRRMHTSKHPEVGTRVKHLEGSIQKVILEDARRKASRRMHTKRKPEGCAIRSPVKGNCENNIHFEKHREGHIQSKKQKRLQ